MSISPTLAMAGQSLGYRVLTQLWNREQHLVLSVATMREICTFLRLSHSAAILPCVSHGRDHRSAVTALTYLSVSRTRQTDLISRRQGERQRSSNHRNFCACFRFFKKQALLFRKSNENLSTPFPKSCGLPVTMDLPWHDVLRCHMRGLHSSRKCGILHNCVIKHPTIEAF